MGSWFWVLAGLLTFAGCGDDDDDDDDDTGTTPDAPIVLETAPTPLQGTAYRLRTSWTWQNTGAIAEPDADVLLRDLDATTTHDTVLCRLSVGRDTDWVDVTRQSGVDFALSQLDAAVAAGCDGVAPADLDGPWDAPARLAFVRHVYNEAHARGLDVAQLDGPDDVADLVAYADLAIAPRCHEQATCDAFAAYTDAGKPVLNAELAASYRDDPAAFCRDALIATTRSIVTDEALDGSFHVSCDLDFPSTTRLADVRTYTTYYGRDAAAIDALADLDLAIVQPLLTSGQRLAIQARGPAVVYLSIGEIGLSNTYLVDGEEVLGQVIYDAHPEWFLGKNPFFDSWFADTRDTGWQDFVLGQSAQLHDLGYDGLFLDTVDTVDVYPETIPGMVQLISRLRAQHPDGILVQNRGMNVIPMSGPDVDALMFEVFSTRYDFDAETYARTDVTAPGYPEIVQKAVDYRLSGGVVLAQDFGDETTPDDLLCYARERALLHRFVPAYADKFFVAAPQTFPAACPWVEEPRAALSFSPRVAHASHDVARTLTLDPVAEGGFTGPVDVTVQAPAGLTATLDRSTLPATLTVQPTALPAGTYVVFVTQDSGRVFTLPVVVHDETAWVTNAGLSNVVAFDEPDTLADPAFPDRITGELVAQPYDIAIAPDGRRVVAENVGDPDAPQPAGRVLIYEPFDLSAPAVAVSTGLLYPTSVAVEDSGAVLVVNSALDWTGTPRGTPSIARIAVGATEAVEAFRYDPAAYGYPLSVAIGPDGTYVGTSYGLVLGFDPGATGLTTPGVALVGNDAFDTVRSLAWHDDRLWLTGAYLTAGRALALPRLWTIGSGTVQLAQSDALAVITSGLYGPWGLDFDGQGRLWVVNSTDADDTVDSRGSLVRFDDPLSDGTPDQTLGLASRYTLGVAVGAP